MPYIKRLDVRNNRAEHLPFSLAIDELLATYRTRERAISALVMGEVNLGSYTYTIERI